MPRQWPSGSAAAPVLHHQAHRDWQLESSEPRDWTPPFACAIRRAYAQTKMLLESHLEVEPRAILNIRLAYRIGDPSGLFGIQRVYRITAA